MEKFELSGAENSENIPLKNNNASQIIENTNNTSENKEAAIIENEDNALDNKERLSHSTQYGHGENAGASSDKEPYQGDDASEPNAFKLAEASENAEYAKSEGESYGPTYSLPEAEELMEIFAPSEATADEACRNLSNADTEDDCDAYEADEKKPFKADGIFEFVELLVITISVVILALSFVCRHSIVEGDSMQNTLQNGEHLIISDLFYTPRQFDIIVFEDRSTGFPKPMIKRVIATEGQRVEIDERGVVRVDGEVLSEDYVFVDGFYTQSRIDYTVPEGEVFVMGDHRNESSDSRRFGSIDEDTILGRVILRFSPLDRFGRVE